MELTNKSEEKKIPEKNVLKKSRIWETLTHSTGADSSTDT